MLMARHSWSVGVSIPWYSTMAEVLDVMKFLLEVALFLAFGFSRLLIIFRVSHFYTHTEFFIEYLYSQYDSSSAAYNALFRTLATLTRSSITSLET